jgi:hypothetical protein
MAVMNPVVRALLYGDLAALLTAAATAVLGGVFAISAGLLVVAAVGGRAIGSMVRTGGGGALVEPSKRTLRLALAITSAILAVVLGQLGLWFVAGLEGGVLSPMDYLGQTFGVLVPLQAILTVGVAAWTTR